MERLLWNAEALAKQHIRMQVCGWAPPSTSFFRGHQCLSSTGWMVPATKLMIGWFVNYQLIVHLSV